MPVRFPKPEPAAKRVHALPANEFKLVSIMAELLAFQANTIDALADYLVCEARKLELTNKTITFEEMKAAAKKLKDYAQDLAPASSCAEGGDR